MRFIFGIILIVAVAGSPGKSNAQTGTINVFAEESTYGNDFLNQPATQTGLVVKNGCGGGKLTGRRSYLVKSYGIYWGLSEECVRVVVNHRATDPSPTQTPTYLGVQVIGFYDSPQSTSIVLRRNGTFVRNGKNLPQYDDKAFASDIDHECGDTDSTGITLPTLSGNAPTTVCLNVLSCMLSNACASATGSGACYCGTAVGSACTVAGSPNGPCIAQEQDGLDSTDPVTINSRFTNIAYAISS